MRRLYEYAANETHNSPQVSLRTLYRSSIEICLHGAKEKQKPIRYIYDDPLSKSSATLRRCGNLVEIIALVCDQKPYQLRFSYRGKSYPA